MECREGSYSITICVKECLRPIIELDIVRVTLHFLILLLYCSSIYWVVVRTVSINLLEKLILIKLFRIPNE